MLLRLPSTRLNLLEPRVHTTQVVISMQNIDMQMDCLKMHRRTMSCSNRCAFLTFLLSMVASPTVLVSVYGHGVHGLGHALQGQDNS